MLTEGVRFAASSLNTGLVVKRATAGGTGVLVSPLGVVAAAAAAAAPGCRPCDAAAYAEPPAADAVPADSTDVLPAAALLREGLPVKLLPPAAVPVEVRPDLGAVLSVRLLDADARGRVLDTVEDLPALWGLGDGFVLSDRSPVRRPEPPDRTPALLLALCCDMLAWVTLPHRSQCLMTDDCLH